jgi:hypothetical protein
MFRLIIICLCFICCSCAVRSVYVPVSLPVPLFDSLRQVQASAYMGVNTFQMQLAYNPVKRFCLGINTNYGAGLGIYEGFVGLHKFSPRSRWRSEILAGGGYTDNYASVDKAWFNLFSRSDQNYETRATYNKFYLQPSIGYFSAIKIYKLTYSFSFTTRLSYLHFQKYIYRHKVTEDPQVDPGSIYLVNKEFYNGDLFLLEPCLTNKVGKGNLFGIIQLLGIMPYSQQIDIRYTKFSPVFLVSIGAQYNFRVKSRGR